eukprot:g6877.t1
MGPDSGHLGSQGLRAFGGTNARPKAQEEERVRLSAENYKRRGQGLGPLQVSTVLRERRRQAEEERLREYDNSVSSTHSSSEDEDETSGSAEEEETSSEDDGEDGAYSSEKDVSELKRRAADVGGKIEEYMSAKPYPRLPAGTEKPHERFTISGRPPLIEDFPESEHAKVRQAYAECIFYGEPTGKVKRKKKKGTNGEQVEEWLDFYIVDPVTGKQIADDEWKEFYCHLYDKGPAGSGSGRRKWLSCRGIS